MANHKGGHFGKILDIDLTSGNISTKEYDEALARKFGVMSIPTIIVFKDGKEAAQKMGYMPYEQLKKFVSEV